MDENKDNKESKDAKVDEGEVKLGGNIALMGFESMDPSEVIVLKKVVGAYVRKMNNHGKYKEMRLSLRQHAHGKTVKHEISGSAVFEEGKFESNVTDYNVYSAVSQVCEKIIQELQHSIKKGDKRDKHSLKKEE